MTSTWVLTGPPGCGKSTVIRRTASELTNRGHRVGGLLAPERREDGRRVGFDICCIDGTNQEAMAREGIDGRRAVGRFGVAVDAIDRAVDACLEPAQTDDVILIDELAPMQFTSERFIAAVTEAVGSSTPVVVTVKAHRRSAYLTRVFDQPPPVPIEVNETNRETLPARLADEIDRTIAGD